MSQATDRWGLLDAVIEGGLVEEADAEAFRDRVRGDWRPPVEALLDQPETPERNALPVAASWLGLPFEMSLEQLAAPDAFFEKVAPEYARRAGVVAVRCDEGALELAIALGQDMADVAAELSRLFGAPAALTLAPRREIESAVDRYARQRSSYLDHAADELGDEALDDAAARVEGVTDFGEIIRKTPVVKLISLLVAQAVRVGASDIHFQPAGDRLMVRFRTDGILHDIIALPRSSQDAILSRIKVLARMDIAERRAPQDGRASFRYAERDVDVRMSVVPTSEGERAVLRLLDREAKPLSLDALGLDLRNLERFEELIRSAHGMILVTGPTGSGKNTTLHAALGRINSPELNIITIEDPVEYQLPGVSQIQVNARKNVTFASMLRSVVRQDPDVIMIGEIRDAETAASAVQSAMTGHLVFSTLHTNDSAGAVARLADLKVEPFYVASALLGVLAQRLVRRVCASCGEETPASQDAIAALDIPEQALAEARFMKGAGCDECLGSGYRGRIGIFEMLSVDDAVRALITRGASSAEIRTEAVRQGMSLLRADGVAKALAGVTTIEEVMRVTQRQDT